MQHGHLQPPCILLQEMEFSWGQRSSGSGEGFVGKHGEVQDGIQTPQFPQHGLNPHQAPTPLSK